MKTETGDFLGIFIWLKHNYGEPHSSEQKQAAQADVSKITSIGKPADCIAVSLKNEIELIRAAVTRQQSFGT